jgi:hypothetical protein
MELFHQEPIREEEPLTPSVPVGLRLQRILGSLAPGQRLFLSVFLFLDVCILCFACLLATRKIALPF